MGDAVIKSTGEGEFGPELFTQQDGEFAQFFDMTLFGLGGGGGMAHELVPDLHDHFPSHGDDGDVALAFAGEEFPAPFA